MSKLKLGCGINVTKPTKPNKVLYSIVNGARIYMGRELEDTSSSPNLQNVTFGRQMDDDKFYKKIYLI